ncbi:hypothetical protein IKG48_01650 [Candidatus Saccharibacteria bacterium]|nr:hypothetical protein [Candidatus Saccharibacteria bacterium]
MTRRKDYTVPALFVTAVVLVFTFLIVSLIFGGKKYPSVKNGATTDQVKEYAYSLLKQDDGTNTLGYNDAVAYYASQISASKNDEQKFNLMLDFAIFYGKTGDPHSGLQILSGINDLEYPLDARYYLYTTYIYLYNRLGDEESVAVYQQKIIDEKIDDYFAGLDNETIEPVKELKKEQPKNESEDSEDSEEPEAGDDSESQESLLEEPEGL